MESVRAAPATDIRRMDRAPSPLSSEEESAMATNSKSHGERNDSAPSSWLGAQTDGGGMHCSVEARASFALSRENGALVGVEGGGSDCGGISENVESDAAFLAGPPDLAAPMAALTSAGKDVDGALRVNCDAPSHLPDNEAGIPSTEEGCNGVIDRSGQNMSPLSDDPVGFAASETDSTAFVEDVATKLENIVGNEQQQVSPNKDVAGVGMAAAEGRGLTNGSAGAALPAGPTEAQKGGSAVLKRAQSPPKGRRTASSTLARSDSAPADMDHSDGEATNAVGSPAEIETRVGNRHRKLTATNPEGDQPQQKHNRSPRSSPVPPGSSADEKSNDRLQGQGQSMAGHLPYQSMGSAPLGTGAVPTYAQLHPQQQDSSGGSGGSGSPVLSLAPYPPSPTPAQGGPYSEGPPPSASASDPDRDTSQMESILTSPASGDDESGRIVARSPHGRYVRFNERLGSGAYKDVYRAYDTIEGIEVAWNEVNLSGVPKSERSRIVNEVRLLERLHHNNIISFHGSWVNRELEQVIFVTEILSSGTLKQFINKVQIVRWKIAKRWAIQILKGLEYLHSQDPPIIHRDLKCDNIFINGTSGDLRIGDFGLSTVINNKNRVLSVLGTPEFMAPELYDEVYNEKVDIYAFGMCLLEIFTKEIPYRECTNPAQIYKKVTHGIAPESLRRVRNQEARDFIRLCLGKNDDEGGYTRPSAAELLCHPFLSKRMEDDSEVDVDPLLPAIVETPFQTIRGDSNGGSSITSKRKTSDPDIGTNGQGQQQEPHFETDTSQRADQQPTSAVPVNAGSANNAVPGSTRERRHSFVEGNVDNRSHSFPKVVQSHDVTAMLSKRSAQKDAPLGMKTQGSSAQDDEDHFGDMPDSEVNMKKVKVLMGRGQEIEDDDEHDTSAPAGVQHIATPAAAFALVSEEPSPKQPEQSTAGGSTQQAPTMIVNASATSDVTESKYLSFAAVVAEDAPEEDILKVMLALPVEGETQNVQFDFHLVEDDPVQVAREMVNELQIPAEAVLEISEAISGLARNARIKHPRMVYQQLPLSQQQQNQQQSQQQQHFLMVQPQGMMVQQQPNLGAPGSDESAQQQGMPPVVGDMQSVMSQASLSGSVSVPLMVQPVHSGVMMQPHLVPMGNVPAPMPQAAGSLYQQQQQMQQYAPPTGPPMPASVFGVGQENVQQVTQQVSSMAMVDEAPSGDESEANIPSSAGAQQLPLSASKQDTSARISQESTANRLNQLSAPQPGTIDKASSTTQVQQTAQHVPPVPQQPATQPEKVTSVTPGQVAANVAKAPKSADTAPEPSPTALVAAVTEEESKGNGTSVVVCGNGDDDDDGDDVVEVEELRRLEEDYKKNITRAKKAFDTRMDNLIRSKEDKEVQHMKVLEKHEKEKVEFEKRLKLAEEEQNRRLQTLEKELAQKKESLKVKPGRDASSHKDDQLKAKRKHETQTEEMVSKESKRDSSPVQLASTNLE
uniref:non-specific serine/threonine protein kinase n=1 Tax=Odontella aurita TaxID=265563 RepID=A0A7S4J5M1_9STRA|mmetsp:Transcript_389/g.1143  ORF Transcript_389/g.1143 Transcript_389/m.1143 type:complete len:1465 (+) Transcript_389:413-4807(+)